MCRYFFGTICLLVVLFTAGCSGCGNKPDVKVGPPACIQHDPQIVRTLLAPKAGILPLTVTFNISVEDEDLGVCSEEKLKFHWDFGDHSPERITPDGKRITHIFSTEGTFKVRIWVTDGDKRVSNYVTRFVTVVENKPPVILSFFANPTDKGELGNFSPVFIWQAYDPENAPLNYEIDYGNGVVRKIDNVSQAQYAGYTSPGPYTVRLKAFDNYGASTERTLKVTVVTKIISSDLIQTLGTSIGIDFDDNGGNYYNGLDGPFMYAYVADGPIALKTIRYPLAAFELGENYARAELIGMADPYPDSLAPPSSIESWSDVITYKGMAVVSGGLGFQIFSVNTDPTKKCATLTSVDCFPGTPTQPVVVCPSPNSYGLSSSSISSMALFHPTGSPGGYIIGMIPSNVGQSGGFALIDIDSLASPLGYHHDAVDCPKGWLVAQPYYTYYSKYASGLASDVNAVAADGDYVYAGVQGSAFGSGFRIYNMGSLVENPMQPVSSVFVPYAAESQFNGANGIGVGLSYAEYVTEPIYASRFFPMSDLAPLAKYDDCNESQILASGSTADGTSATLATPRAILKGNRISLQLTGAGGAWDNNGGAGYTVLTNAGNFTQISPKPPSAPADWYSIATTATSYSILGRYPGNNPVTLTTQPGVVVARNNKCSNFLNAYSAITGPVEASFFAAPLVFAMITTHGLVAFDRSNPEQVSWLSSSYSGGSIMGVAHANIEVHGQFIYLSGGSGGVQVFNISDPLHLEESAGDTAQIGTFCQQTCGPQYPDKPWDFAVNELRYVTTPANPAGALVIASGAMGLTGLYFADELAENTLANLGVNCGSVTADSPCMDRVPGLQLRHEGPIATIELVTDQYALVAQRRGGVLIYDISGLKYGQPVSFVSHIATRGSPSALRVITDAVTWQPKTLYIADSTSLYRIPFADPANPPLSVGSTPGGGYNYNCVEYTVGKVFICYTVTVNTSAVPKGMYANGDTLPSLGMIIGTSTDTVGHNCIPNGSELAETYESFQGDVLGGRQFIFASTGSLYGATILELLNNGTGCQWQAWGSSASSVYYHKRLGEHASKRLYIGGTSSGWILVYDIDSFESDLADPLFNLGITPPLMGSVNLSASNNNVNVSVSRIVAVGNFLFVAGNTTGAWVINATNPTNMGVIGQTSISAPGTLASTINAMAYPDDPNNPVTSTYTYVALVSDNRPIGGVKLLRFPGLEKP